MQLAAYPNKSTTVRLSIAAIRAAFRTLGALAPGAAAALAGRLWARPPRAALRPAHRALLASASHHRLRLGEERLAFYAWGDGGPWVLLVHGWGGHAGQMTPWVAPLLAAGLRVLAFDAPGHGASGRGEATVPRFGAAIELAARFTGGFQGIVAHSVGAASTAWALHHHRVPARRAVFVGPAADMTDASRRFASLLGLSDEVRKAMQRRFEVRLQLPWDRLHVPAVAPSMTTELLVFHDGGDREVPPEEGAAIAAAWPRATLWRTEGLGHHRILRDPTVLEASVRFLAAEADQPIRR